MNIRKPIRELFFALPAALMAVWCVIAVAGIDIHRDNEHGGTYVVLGFSASDCEDIHPDSHCHDSCSEGECDQDESCCSDEFLSVLAISEDINLDSSISCKAALPDIICQAPDVQVINSGYRIFRLCASPPDPASYFSKLSVLRV